MCIAIGLLVVRDVTLVARVCHNVVVNGIAITANSKKGMRPHVLQMLSVGCPVAGKQALKETENK